MWTVISSFPLSYWRPPILRLMRNGYNVKSLCDLLNSKPREITAFIHGQLPPERTQQLSSQLLAVGAVSSARHVSRNRFRQ